MGDDAVALTVVAVVVQIHALYTWEWQIDVTRRWRVASDLRLRLTLWPSDALSP
jgi:hypothetical protein